MKRRQVSDEQRSQILELRKRGVSYRDISDKLGVSFSYINNHITAHNAGFESITEYEKHLAKQRGFKSLNEYKKHLAKQRINPESGEPFESLIEYREHLVKQKGFESITEYEKHLAKQRGFKSLREYQEHLAKQKGFKTLREYQEQWIKEKGFESTTEYQKHRAKQKGFESITEYKKHLVKQRINPESGEPFESFTEYEKHLAKERQERAENQELSRLLKERLTELGKTQNWLAEELGVTQASVSRYVDGKTTPRKSLQESLFKILGLEYKTLDDLME